MFKDHTPPPNSGTVSRSRQRRRQMSLPEVLLWRILKTRPHGLKFRREHGTGDYSLDFYCLDARLAVEVDGQAHAMGERPRRDARRDAWLAQAGIETLRIPATEVLRDAAAATDSIVEYARSRLPLHHPAALAKNPPPPGCAGGPPPRD